MRLRPFAEAASGSGELALKQRYALPADFEAEIGILSEEEGGRSIPAFNGIRWDFAYGDLLPTDDQYMIWPDFMSGSGDSLESDIPLSGTLRARMHIVNRDARVTVHRPRIEVGVGFFCMEGARQVARGVVTKVTGLADVALDPEPGVDRGPP